MKRITRVKNHWRRHSQPNCKEKWCQNVKMVPWTSDQTHVLRTRDRGQSTEKTRYVAQNKGKDKFKKKRSLDSKSLLGVRWDSQKLLKLARCYIHINARVLYSLVK